jgi:3'-phosphoadenosine 5'-phosphosulfate sulfotransferase (PAPS reductase)/FAD synthetase
MALTKSEKPVVSCSFGIDSIVTLYLVKKALAEMDRPIDSVHVAWNDTANEFPDVRKYQKKITADWGLNLIVSKPEKTLKHIINDNGGVTAEYFFARKGKRGGKKPLSEKCCGTLKHKPMQKMIKENKWDLVINGLRADESSQRFKVALRDGSYFYSVREWKAYVLRPIQWFNEKEIWQYVAQENIPYNDLYDKNLIKSGERAGEQVGRMEATLLAEQGVDIFTPRTGCMLCPIPIRFGYVQWMRRFYPKAHDAMIYNLEYGKALLSMIPEDAKAEIKAFTGIDVNEENAWEHLRDILDSKPCTFDKF